MMQHRLKKAAGLGLSRGEAGFQLVAQGHQLVNPGNDVLLLGEKRERDTKVPDGIGSWNSAESFQKVKNNTSPSSLVFHVCQPLEPLAVIYHGEQRGFSDSESFSFASFLPDVPERKRK